ncbi:MAG: response regulator [Chitinophagaceae bacterium]|nr:MAG: response regulator [Chitinophagaceae bacterium]
MNKKGPIVFFEDDRDDQEILKEIFAELRIPNELLFFDNGQSALDFLRSSPVQPFLIVSDINMPLLNGIELRDRVLKNADLRAKAIPYVFFSTTAEADCVTEAYANSIQGFFIKPGGYMQLKRMMGIIIDYWLECVSPEYPAHGKAARAGGEC